MSAVGVSYLENRVILQLQLLSMSTVVSDSSSYMVREQMAIHFCGTSKVRYEQVAHTHMPSKIFALEPLIQCAISGVP